MRINLPIFRIVSLLLSIGVLLSACTSSIAPLPAQTTAKIESQPVKPTDTQLPSPTNTQPLLPTDTQSPLPTDTQPVPPTDTQAPPTSTEITPSISGAALLDSRCTVCHSKVKVTGKHKSQSEWKRTVESMVLRGAILTPEEQAILVAYLSQNY